MRPNEFPSIDPDGKAFFITLSEGGPDRFAVYAKHPAYAWVLTAADRLGGVFTMTLVSVVAAVLAALVGRAHRQALGSVARRWAFWVLGLGSPLLFDSQVVLAHTIGAAFAGFATLLVLRAVERPSVRETSRARSCS